MKVILIRHGQTDENVAHRHQPVDTPLSVLGRKQAVETGKTLQTVGVTHVVSSPIVRALQTASLIADQLDIIPSIDYSLRELERPRSMTGRRHFSLRSLLFYKFWFLGIARAGETYRELRERIIVARENLERLPDDAVVVVVSHTVFINLFLAHLDRRVPLWPWQAALVFLRLVRMKNTEMVVLNVTDERWTKVG